MTVLWYVSCPRFSVGVVTKNQIITEAPPIVRVFIGQPLSNLVQWAKRFGETTHERVQEEEKSYVSRD